MAVLWQLFGIKRMSAGLVFHLGREKEKQERLGDEGVLSGQAGLHSNAEMKRALGERHFCTSTVD